MKIDFKAGKCLTINILPALYINPWMCFYSEGFTIHLSWFIFLIGVRVKFSK